MSAKEGSRESWLKGSTLLGVKSLDDAKYLNGKLGSRGMVDCWLPPWRSQHETGVLNKYTREDKG